jgi:BirA family biotin operon repressor/biotin-[acetyl-CoA-carboxylase] ligase
MAYTLCRLFRRTFSIFETTAKWLHDGHFSFEALPTVTSTNDLAKQQADTKENKDLRIFLTDEQTKGRGRGSNGWSNPSPGHSLMCTWAFALKSSPKAVTAPIVGLAIYKALKEAYATAPLSLKAPNDIYLGPHKLLGILVETLSQGESYRLLIGFGCNVFSHPSDVPTATHLDAKVLVTKKNWLNFLSILDFELRAASRDCQGAHLTDGQRQELLAALNKNPLLTEPFTSVSPFGDLSTATHTSLWRDL